MAAGRRSSLSLRVLTAETERARAEGRGVERALLTDAGRRARLVEALRVLAGRVLVVVGRGAVEVASARVLASLELEHLTNEHQSTRETVDAAFRPGRPRPRRRASGLATA